MDRIERFADHGRVTRLFKNRIEQFLESRPDRLSKVEQEAHKIEKEIDRLMEIYVKFERPVPEDKICELNLRKKALRVEREALIAAGEKKVAFDADTEVARFLSNVKGVRGHVN